MIVDSAFLQVWTTGPVGLILSVAIERFLHPQPRFFRPGSAWLLHICLWCFCYALFILILGRPWCALVAVSAILITLTVVSNAKYKSLREPFIAQDYDYFLDTLRFPRLFLPFLGLKNFCLAALFFVLALLGFWTEEPPASRFSLQGQLGGALVLLLGTAVLLWRQRNHASPAVFDPEKDLQCIHIAGTNGKGSLAAMTASILTAAGYKTGLTISPFVVEFRERFQIDGQMIPPRTLAQLTEKVMDAIDDIRQEGGETPVEFEAVTAVALLWFAREKCDLVVLETGLGGRYDATNAVPHTLVAAITRIGYDHTDLLGETLDNIAAEKAGIIKEGCAVVCYPDQPPEAMGPILAAAAEAHTSILSPFLKKLDTHCIHVCSQRSYSCFSASGCIVTTQIVHQPCIMRVITLINLHTALKYLTNMQLFICN